MPIKQSSRAFVLALPLLLCACAGNPQKCPPPVPMPEPPADLMQEPLEEKHFEKRLDAILVSAGISGRTSTH